MRALRDRVKDVAGGGEAGFDAGVSGVNASLHYSAEAGNELRLAGDADDAGGGADYVDHVFFERARADGIPVGIEGADGNGNSGAQAEFFGPDGRESTGDFVGSFVGTLQFLADAGEQRVHFHEEFFGGQTAESGMPEPFVAHSADAAFYSGGIGDAAESGGDHVAVFESAGETGAFIGIVAQPVEEFGETPFGGVHAAAPFNGFEIFAMSHRGDFGGFGFGAVIAPQIVFVERNHSGGDGDDGGAGGIESDGGDLVAGDAGILKSLFGGGGEGAHVVFVGLRGELGIFAFTVEGIFGDGGIEDAFFAIHDGDAHAESAKIDAGYHGHIGLLVILCLQNRGFKR